MAFFSFTVTPTASAQCVTSRDILVSGNSQGIKNVKQFSIVVRSLGNASYIGVGGSNSQDRRLSVAGAGFAIDAPAAYRAVNLSQIFISSDGTTPVVEVFGETV